MLFRSEHFFGSVNQISYDRRKALGAYYHLYSRDNFSFNWTIGQNNLISFGSEFEFRNRKAVIKAKDRGSYIMDSMLSKSPYYNVNFFLKLERNTLDKPFFPNKGILAKSTLKYVPWEMDISECIVMKKILSQKISSIITKP